MGLKVFPQRPNDALGRFLLEPLHNEGSGFGGLGLDQHMKMFGHQNPADEQEMPFLPHLVKPLDKAKAIREEKWRAAIGAGGDELEFTGTVNAVVKGHGAGEHTLDGAWSEENVPAGERRHQKSGAPASVMATYRAKSLVSAEPLDRQYLAPRRAEGFFCDHRRILSECTAIHSEPAPRVTTVCATCSAEFPDNISQKIPRP